MSALANISTPRLHIRPFGSDEAGDLRRLTDHPAITGPIDFLSSPFDDDAAVALIARNGEEECFLGLWDGDDLVGCVGVHLRAGERIEIGYWIDAARHGRGYASEGVAAVLHALQGAHPDRRIVAECRPANLASWRLLHKLGFRDTGEAGDRIGRALLMLA
ncbi:GNAT family N-acetyltransferase [Microvirga sp. SRT01]|uniref:GNAT family N-acetyltransferase n=1 Tax=Sphingomonas longa TaxID=2778730 RepID=A0ABS2D4B8_9SPHN|nr:MULTISPECIES: GNAT family N-acetyltransferase [Alphaproteobacteria]MBM6575754.1 GNAT family N-acetyltransferase [Sphingomonas sp. BT552]MBR7708801.1 GNAT family N-acetyltransferase [Microvirga sp. SRT01]